jgi:hypothetical protein
VFCGEHIVVHFHALPPLGPLLQPPVVLTCVLAPLVPLLLPRAVLTRVLPPPVFFGKCVIYCVLYLVSHVQQILLFNDQHSLHDAILYQNEDSLLQNEL